MSEARVSVVIPTHDRAGRVERAIDSAVGQSHPPAEVIVVDDGSRDGTVSRLAVYRDRIALLEQRHRGVSAARNRGIRHATGSFVAFLDSDDRWGENHLARLVEALEREGGIPWACSNALVEEEGVRTGRLLNPAGRADSRGALDFFSAAGQGVRFHTSALLVRRDLLIALGGFDEARRHAEDLDLWWRIARREPRIVYDPQPTVVVEAGSPDALTRKYREAALDMCDLVERHLVAFDRRAQRRAFQRLARRLLDVYASRALHGGSYDDLLELDRRVGRPLPLRRRFLAAGLRALPQ